MLYVMLMEYTNCLILSQKRKLIEYYYQFCYILLYTLARKRKLEEIKGSVQLSIFQSRDCLISG